MPYIPPPSIPPAFSHLQPARRKTRHGSLIRKRWVDAQGNIYEWDYQHGTVEMYDPRGRHVGEFDPLDGHQVKPADPMRRVEP